MSSDLPKRIGYVGGAISAIVVANVSKPGNAIEAAKMGGAAGSIGFLVTYTLAEVVCLFIKASRDKQK